MKSDNESLLDAPFPYFGGKKRAAELVWSLFGDVPNYVEPFAGSVAMLLNRPGGAGKVETINDACGFIANFWRSIRHDPDATAFHADWPVNEADLEARHGWLINRSKLLRDWLEDPDWYDPKIAGWWCWGACSWIGSGWCEGRGPWQSNGAELTDTRKLPHVGNAGMGINRQLPHVGDAGKGINRKLPHVGDAGRGDFIRQWFADLSHRLRNVRVACGDWSRVCTDSVTVRHGLTGVFLDPPYTQGEMQYAAGGVGGDLASDVRAWCAEAGANPLLRIVLCGHAGEHDGLIEHGWTVHQWKARKGYAATKEATDRAKSETVWASPHCVTAMKDAGVFDLVGK
jgi:DNA adenine methylase